MLGPKNHSKFLNKLNVNDGDYNRLKEAHIFEEIRFRSFLKSTEPENQNVLKKRLFLNGNVSYSFFVLSIWSFE